MHSYYLSILPVAGWKMSNCLPRVACEGLVACDLLANCTIAAVVR